jgi:simple sugar transport system permease protein
MTIAMMTGGIDLSVVGVANLSAVLAAIILTNFSGPEMAPAQSVWWLVLAIVAALLIGAIAGLVNGSLIAFFGLPPILATLGSGLVFTGFAIAMTGGSAVMGFPDTVALIGNAQVFGIPIPLILFSLLAAILHLILTRTAFGLSVTMYGANPLAALYAAINLNRMLLKVYVISGMFSSVAGLIVMSRANSAKADYGSSYLLLAVLIAVLGGVNPYGGYGRVIGVVLAVLSMQFLSSGLNMLQVSNFARELIWGVLLIVVMVLNTHSLTYLRSSLSKAPK